MENNLRAFESCDQWQRPSGKLHQHGFRLSRDELRKMSRSARMLLIRPTIISLFRAPTLTQKVRSDCSRK